MLLLDKLDELGGADTGLVAEGEAFREELDEAKFERVANEPVINTTLLSWGAPEPT